MIEMQLQMQQVQERRMVGSSASPFSIVIAVSVVSQVVLR
jgi:hypothetical protein